MSHRLAGPPELRPAQPSTEFEAGDDRERPAGRSVGSLPAGVSPSLPDTTRRAPGFGTSPAGRSRRTGRGRCCNQVATRSDRAAKSSEATIRTVKSRARRSRFTAEYRQDSGVERSTPRRKCTEESQPTIDKPRRRTKRGTGQRPTLESEQAPCQRPPPESTGKSYPGTNPAIPSISPLFLGFPCLRSTSRDAPRPHRLACPSPRPTENCSHRCARLHPGSLRPGAGPERRAPRASRA